jgi:hypothetical protein
VTDAILLLRDGQLQELSDQPYDSEVLLQRLLQDHPSVIAGSQIDRADPRRWLLVSREMPVASEEDGGRRWSLDHLFLDQDGIPTLVEVKRGTDTRIRREVVGQMLDYAANAIKLTSLLVPDQLRQFLAVLDWAVAEIRLIEDGGKVLEP